ncbi:MAG: hypothetical protein WC632_01490 [Candidatus Margulisiibacteriota bacterium]
MAGPEASSNINTSRANPAPRTAANIPNENELWAKLQAADPDDRFEAVQQLKRLCQARPILKYPEKIELVLRAYKNEFDRYNQEKNQNKKEVLAHVIGSFIDLFVKFKIKEAGPLLNKGLSDPNIGWLFALAVAEIGNASAIPALQAQFSQTPSRISAVALLKLGEPGVYRDNYLQEDLKIFDEPDDRLIYPNVTERQMALGIAERGCSPFGGMMAPINPNNPPFGPGLPNWAVVSKCSYTQISVPTTAAGMKPEIKENIGLLIGALAEKHDGQKLIPLLLTLLYHPKHPIDKPTIAAAFKRVVAQSDIPLLLEQLKRFPYPDTLSLISPFFKEQIAAGFLAPETHQAVVEAFKGLLNQRELRSVALDFLAETKERSIIEYLERTIKTTGYCAAEVEALAGLRNHPAEFENVFYKVLADEKYKTTTEDARFYAALALSQSLAGRKDAAAARMAMRLSGFLTNKLADPASSAKETLLLLESFKDLQEPAYIPDVLAKLKQSRAALGAIPAHCPPELMPAKKENQVVRFFATLTIAGLATKDNTEALKTIDEEMSYWKSYLAEVEREHTAMTTAPEQYQFALQVKSFVQLVEKIKDDEAVNKNADQPAKP